MPKAYEISLPDGTKMQVIPQNVAEQALVTIDDYKLLLTPNDDGFATEIVENGQSVVSGSSVGEVDVEISERVAESEVESLLGRRCIICQGRRYCVTNACANTPCGWICG